MSSASVGQHAGQYYTCCVCTSGAVSDTQVATAASCLRAVLCCALLVSGIPSESEMLQAYCAAAGRQLPTPHAWSFYLALSLFRLLAILAGVQVRITHSLCVCSMMHYSLTHCLHCDATVYALLTACCCAHASLQAMCKSCSCSHTAPLHTSGSHVGLACIALIPLSYERVLCTVLCARRHHTCKLVPAVTAVASSAVFVCRRGPGRAMHLLPLQPPLAVTQCCHHLQQQHWTSAAEPVAAAAAAIAAAPAIGLNCLQ